jgi:hypothetical protein
MGAPIEHVAEGPTPAAIANFFFERPVGTMPVSPAAINTDLEFLIERVSRQAAKHRRNNDPRHDGEGF